jgi:uncharacterized protein DUF4142
MVSQPQRKSPVLSASAQALREPYRGSPCEAAVGSHRLDLPPPRHHGGCRAKDGDNPRLKAFAADLLPTLQGHLEHVKKLK